MAETSTAKLRVLFVDDEVKVLEGLERMLRPMRRDWSMTFAPGGEEALEQLAAHDFDVLVTDIRMPGVDGAELLSRVTDQHPGVVRLVLSGQSDSEIAIRSTGLAHEYLSKPCPADVLKAVINDAGKLAQLLKKPDLVNQAGLFSGTSSVSGLLSELRPFRPQSCEHSQTGS